MHALNSGELSDMSRMDGNYTPEMQRPITKTYMLQLLVLQHQRAGKDRRQSAGEELSKSLRLLPAPELQKWHNGGLWRISLSVKKFLTDARTGLFRDY